MFAAVTAIRFHRPMGKGKTAPSLMTCLRGDGSEVEVVVKCAAGCEGGIGALRREAIAAFLAADLDLPVPEPLLVRLEADFVAAIPESDERRSLAKRHAEASLGWNFGSSLLPPGYSTIAVDRPIPRNLLSTAAEILAFDTFVNNPDRTVANPNCQSNGRTLSIFDHELAFLVEGVLFWRPPWEEGGIVFPKGQPANLRHVFLEELRGAGSDFSRLGGAFDGITAKRLEEYRSALPPEWIGDGAAVAAILDYIAALKTHIDATIKNMSAALQ